MFSYYGSSRLGVLQKDVLRNFLKFTRKACNFIKKRDSGTGVFLWILLNFKNTCFTELLRTTVSRFPDLSENLKFSSQQTINSSLYPFAANFTFLYHLKTSKNLAFTVNRNWTFNTNYLQCFTNKYISRNSFYHSHKKQKDSLETWAVFSWILLLTWNFGGGRSDSASIFFKIASASWLWCY